MLTFVMMVALTQVDGGTPAPALDAPLRNGAHLCGSRELKPDGGVDDLVPGCVQILNVGAPAPFAGVVLDEQEDVHRTAREERKTVKVKEYETGNFIMPTAAYVGITGGAVGVAIALTLGLLAGTGHLK